ncbi:hypothetical protein B0J12DRAFT_196119 [Macrophomina phaseolina]|uniref:Transmembrane protein n=1 Tax=Macrophomina phaseolina TaxID=35725 RepID=A0ABQ8G2W8_9PEZI|nr:hypothetical protein B0J12DRAFT_196119 [Macrophomina phaseolina]
MHVHAHVDIILYRHLRSGGFLEWPSGCVLPLLAPSFFLPLLQPMQGKFFGVTADIQLSRCCGEEEREREFHHLLCATNRTPCFSFFSSTWRYNGAIHEIIRRRSLQNMTITFFLFPVVLLPYVETIVLRLYHVLPIWVCFIAMLRSWLASQPFLGKLLSSPPSLSSVSLPAAVFRWLRLVEEGVMVAAKKPVAGSES